MAQSRKVLQARKCRRDPSPPHFTHDASLFCTTHQWTDQGREFPLTPLPPGSSFPTFQWLLYTEFTCRHGRRTVSI